MMTMLTITTWKEKRKNLWRKEISQYLHDNIKENNDLNENYTKRKKIAWKKKGVNTSGEHIYP